MADLAEGAIKTIIEEGGRSGVTAPVPTPLLQILKLWHTSSRGPDRYFVNISDGTHFMPAQLGTQLHARAKCGEFYENSIAMLTEYKCHRIADQVHVTILEIDTIPVDVDRIGNPTSLGAVGGGAGSSSGMGAAPESPSARAAKAANAARSGTAGSRGAPTSPSAPQTPSSPRLPSSALSSPQHPTFSSPPGVPFSGGFMPTSPTPSPPSASIQSNRGPANADPGSSPLRSPSAGLGSAQQSPAAPGSGGGPSPGSPMRVTHQPGQFQGGSVPAEPQGPVYPIKGLSPYQNRWTIKARVTSKSALMDKTGAKWKGKLFNVTLLDESGEIKATGFDHAAELLYDAFELHKAVYITGGKVSRAKRQFSRVDNDFEIILQTSTKVVPCIDSASVPTVQFNFVPLNTLDSHAKDAIIDVIGIVKEDHQVSEIIARATSKPVKKRELSIVDATGYIVRLTLWGKQAEDFSAPGDAPAVIACKNVKVGDFGGRSLSVMSDSTVSLNPEIPEAEALRRWFDTQGAVTGFQSHALLNGSGAGSQRSDERKTFAAVKDERLGEGDKPDYFSAIGTIYHIRPENMTYPACASETCNKKVTEENGMWRCEKCKRSYPEPDHRYIMTMNVVDYTDQLWLQGFNDVGPTILGMTANELVALRTNSPTEHDTVVARANFKTYVFKCRAKTEVFNDQSKVRYTISTATPIDIVAECGNLIEQISKYH